MDLKHGVTITILLLTVLNSTRALQNWPTYPHPHSKPGKNYSCYMCPPGYYKSRDCILPRNDEPGYPECLPCPPSQFSQRWNNDGRCWDHDKCENGHVEIYNGKKIGPTKCACVGAMLEDNNGYCVSGITLTEHEREIERLKKIHQTELNEATAKTLPVSCPTCPTQDTSTVSAVICPTHTPAKCERSSCSLTIAILIAASCGTLVGALAVWCFWKRKLISTLFSRCMVCKVMKRSKNGAKSNEAAQKAKNSTTEDKKDETEPFVKKKSELAGTPRNSISSKEGKDKADKESLIVDAIPSKEDNHDEVDKKQPTAKIVDECKNLSKRSSRSSLGSTGKLEKDNAPKNDQDDKKIRMEPEVVNVEHQQATEKAVPYGDPLMREPPRRQIGHNSPRNSRGDEVARNQLPTEAGQHVASLVPVLDTNHDKDRQLDDALRIMESNIVSVRDADDILRHVFKLTASVTEGIKDDKKDRKEILREGFKKWKQTSGDKANMQVLLAALRAHEQNAIAQEIVKKLDNREEGMQITGVTNDSKRRDARLDLAIKTCENFEIDDKMKEFFTSSLQLSNQEVASIRNTHTGRREIMRNVLLKWKGKNSDATPEKLQQLFLDADMKNHADAIDADLAENDETLEENSTPQKENSEDTALKAIPTSNLIAGTVAESSLADLAGRDPLPSTSSPLPSAEPSTSGSEASSRNRQLSSDSANQDPISSPSGDNSTIAEGEGASSGPSSLSSSTQGTLQDDYKRILKDEGTETIEDIDHVESHDSENNKTAISEDTTISSSNGSAKCNGSDKTLKTPTEKAKITHSKGREIPVIHKERKKQND